MTFLPLFERKDACGRSTGRSRAAARTHSFAQVDHLSGQALLLPGRESAGVCPPSLRVTPERAARSARRSGFYSFDAHLHVSRQAVRNALHHLNSLSSVASSFVSKNGRKRGQIIGKVSQEAR